MTALREPATGPLDDPSLLIEKAFAGGSWIEADSGATIAVVNPAHGGVVGHVPACGVGETRRAIESAEIAQRGWRAMTAAARGAIIEEWYRLIMAAQTDLARIMTAEQGKPLAEAAGEIAYAASFLKWFAAQGLRAGGHEVPRPLPTGAFSCARSPSG
jgi:succinate-semialdehyde dehydrogenase/glutarate-semialdehyde dehydrogenase